MFRSVGHYDQGGYAHQVEQGAVTASSAAGVQGTFPNAGPAQVSVGSASWTWSSAPADAFAGPSGTAFAVSRYMSGAATAPTAGRNLGARLRSTRTGRSKPSRSAGTYRPSTHGAFAP